MIEFTSVLLIIAAGSAAIAAFLSWRASKEHTWTVIMPHLMVYSSDLRHRTNLAHANELNGRHTKIPGIRVHNVGIGPAVKGIIYLCHKEKEERVVEPNEQYTFYGIPSGRSFYFPSNDAPELEKYLKPDTNSLLIRIVHYDLHGNEYHLPKGKKWEEVKLQTVRDWKQKVSGQKDNEEQKLG